MAQKAFRVVDPANAPSSAPAKAGTIVPFRQKLLPRHRHYIDQWLAASERMGILDAAIETGPGTKDAGTALIVIWVRENPNPAYTIGLEDTQWVLTDSLRNNELGRYRDLCEALHTIRPVLPIQPEDPGPC